MADTGETPAVQVRPDDAGGVDEIVAHGVERLHIERLTNDGWFMGIEDRDGRYWRFWFGAKNGRSSVVFTHQERPDNG